MAGRQLGKRPGLDGATAPTAGTPQLPERTPGNNGAPPAGADRVRELGAAHARAVESVPPDFGNKLDNKLATNPDIALSDFLAGRPTPEADLVQRGWRVPRYVGEAVRLAGMRERAPEQNIVLRALLADPDLQPYLSLAYARAIEQERR